jgi:beta-phosphoglucomutase-like phosphatase (HAD superfamily)
MTIKAILFDMDGVLVDARDWHYEALNRALDLFGFAIDRDAHLATFDGLPTRKKLEILSTTRRLPFKLHPFINKLKQQYTVQTIYAKCRPTFHHQYALAELGRDGYRLVVCSNSIRQTVSLMMQMSRLEQYLDRQFSNEDVTNPKPHPEMYVLAMEQLGVKPEESLILEDNAHGIEAALKSGGHLMQIETINDVTYSRIRAKIAEIQSFGQARCRY